MTNPDHLGAARSQEWLELQRDHDMIAEEVLELTAAPPEAELGWPAGKDIEARAKQFGFDLIFLGPHQKGAKP